MSSKYLSFSLYGNDPKYVQGLLENIKIKEEQGIYKDWITVVFHDNSVESHTLEEIKNKEAVICCNMTESGVLAASWRFCVDEVAEMIGSVGDRFIVRDADSRISKREEEAVNEWIKDDTTLHIMRDHPHHGYPMNGGMWGMKLLENSNRHCMRDAITAHQGNKQVSSFNSKRTNWWMKDMDFLRDVIYPEFGTCFESTIHNAMDFMNRVPWNCESWAKDFPSPIGKEKHFVGEIFIFDEHGIEQREHQFRER